MAKLLFYYLAIYDSLRNSESSELCYGKSKKKKSPISFFICKKVASVAVT